MIIASAGIILASDDPRSVLSVIRLSQESYTIMRQNLWWAAAYNALCVPLAVLGWERAALLLWCLLMGVAASANAFGVIMEILGGLLDVALKALFELQKSGRLIGIISHVEELRSRIPARLEVTKTKSGGSTAHFELGTAES